MIIQNPPFRHSHNFFKNCYFVKKIPINTHIAKWLSLSRREDFIQGVIHNFDRTLLFKGDLMSKGISNLIPSSKSWTKSLVSTFQPKAKKLKIVISSRFFWEWNQIEKTFWDYTTFTWKFWAYPPTRARLQHCLCSETNPMFGEAIIRYNRNAFL